MADLMKEKINRMGIVIDSDIIILPIITLFYQKMKTMQDTFLFQKLVEELNIWKVEVNIEETKYVVNRAEKQNLFTDKGIIKYVKGYKYSGVTLTSDR